MRQLTTAAISERLGKLSVLTTTYTGSGWRTPPNAPAKCKGTDTNARAAERNNEQSTANRAGQLVSSSAPWVNVSDADSHRVHEAHMPLNRRTAIKQML